MDENSISYDVIGTAFRVHTKIGPGLLESVYEYVLAFELKDIGFEVITQKPLPFIYRGNRLEVGFRIDLIVNSKVLIEIKSVESLAPVQFAQTLTYLRISGLKLGLLINFNTKSLKHGIHRVVNNL